ncbi:MAG TPA: hypothetical protein VG713_01225 [Pirellulales bacterium]|nr:hypothetical protein [Pirellulales bacterium]
MSDDNLVQRALSYAELCKITLDLATPLGHGTDGSVWRSSRETAVKALKLEHNYHIELTCYQRLAAAGVVKLLRFAVPQLIGSNDDLLVIEMRIVTAPYVLDFAKAYLDERPDFSAEKWEAWREECEERFDEHWPEVQTLIWVLQKYGIYYYDAKPANIRIAGDD